MSIRAIRKRLMHKRDAERVIQLERSVRQYERLPNPPLALFVFGLVFFVAGLLIGKSL